MLSPYPFRMRPRAHSNPARPKLNRSPHSSSDHASSSTEVDAIAKKQAAAKKPRRGGSLFSSTAHLVPPVPTSPSPAIPTIPLPPPVPPAPATSPSQDVVPSHHAPDATQSHPKPPHRPPRNPARKSIEPPIANPFPLPIPSPFQGPGPAPRRMSTASTSSARPSISSVRPSSSSGARDSKAMWDPTSSAAGGDVGVGIGKLVRRHKSTNYAQNNGPPPSVSLFTRVGRMERRGHDKESEKQSASAPQKGKEKEKEKEEKNKSPSSPGGSFTHALNTYYTSLTVTPRNSSVSLRKTSQPSTTSHKRVETSPGGLSPRESHHVSHTHSPSSESISASSSSHSREKGKGKEQAPAPTSAPDLNTADRTILHELKLSLSAHDSQFVLKGPSPSCSSPFGLGLTDGTRHHPYPAAEVPYPRSYARSAVDLDVWETKWCEQLCGSLTWNVFPPDAPPKKVLDLGCGTGTWIMECTKMWKDAQFVGLDIVPLQPDLKRVGSRDAARVHWVQANFLEVLPFPNDEFDFVHVKRIARAVPEDKWDALFEEIARVMKPGAAFEMLEEELYWPGTLRDVDGDSLADSDSEAYASPRSRSRTPSPDRSSLSELSRAHARSESPATPRPTNRRNTDPPMPSWTLTSPSPAAKRHDARPRSVFAPSSPRLPSLSISTMLESPGPETPRDHKFASPVMRPSVSTGSTMESATPSNYRGSFSPSRESSPPTSPHTSPVQSTFTTSPLSPLVRTAPLAPPNPHDHSVLEAIYTEMHAQRFINLAPLSLLTNSLSLWFKDLRTHPPLNLTFPPPPVHPRRRSPEPRATEYDDDSDAENSQSESDLFVHSEEDSGDTTQADAAKADTHFVTKVGLLLGTSPYVFLDDGQFAAFSPSTKASFPSAMQGTPSSPVMAHPWTVMDNELADANPDAVVKALEELPPVPAPPPEGPPSQMQQLAAALANYKLRLPNPQMRFDLRTLNLHLALRTAEVLACAEAMWEWVVAYQAELKKRTKMRGARATLASPLREPVRSTIAELSRAEFDGLISQFDMDMRDQYSVGSVLEDRFAWSVISMPSHQDRKAFDTACNMWEKYQHKKRLGRATEAQAQPVVQQGRRHSHSQLLSESSTTFGHLPTIPDSISLRNASGRPMMDFEEDEEGVPPSQDDAGVSPSQLHRSDSHKSSRRGTSAGRTARRKVSRNQSQVSLGLPLEYDGGDAPGDQPHPSGRLCRTLRVFVAWKA